MPSTSISGILDTVGNVLSVIKKVTETPGINALPYVSTASFAISALQAALKAGQNVAPYVSEIAKTFSDPDSVPTQEKLDALRARIAQLEAEADRPLPPPEEGETD